MSVEPCQSRPLTQNRYERTHDRPDTIANGAREPASRALRTGSPPSQIGSGSLVWSSFSAPCHGNSRTAAVALVAGDGSSQQVLRRIHCRLLGRTIARLHASSAGLGEVFRPREAAAQPERIGDFG